MSDADRVRFLAHLEWASSVVESWPPEMRSRLGHDPFNGRIKKAGLKLRYHRFEPDAYKPTKGHKGDAGWDVRSREYVSIGPGKAHKFDLGLAAWLADDGYYLRGAERSGLADNFKISLLGGVIDAPYRGRIKIVLANLGERTWHVEPGMKIAQLIPERIVDCDEAEEAEIEETSRGDNGFGSTGV